MSLIDRIPPAVLQRAARFVAVVAIALAAGHLVQSFSAKKVEKNDVVSKIVPIEIVQLSASGPPKPAVVPEISVQSVAFTPPPTAAAQVQPLSVAVLPIVGKACGIDLILLAQPFGMIGVTLDAPCHRSERIVMRHAGLAFTAKTGADGTLTLAVPAMDSADQVQVRFADRSSTDAAIAMPQAATLHRFGVQWQGGDSFAIHALRPTTGWDPAEDISFAREASTGENGFATTLGEADVENPLLAQVYTYPADASQPPQIVVEAAVNEATCGHDLLGEVLLSQRGHVVVTDLILAMPDCSGVGDFLVLNNLTSDMKIATN